MKKIYLVLLCLIPLISSGQVVATIGTGTANSLYGPIYISSSASPNTHSWNLSIFEASEINSAGGFAGNISEIKWNKADTGSYPFNDGVFQIYMKHTSLSSFVTTGNFSTDSAGATLVYSSTSQKLTNSIGWIPFPFSNPFNWNGTSNIMILTRWVRVQNAIDGVNWVSTSITPTHLSHSFNSSAAMGTLYTTPNRPNVQLTFNSLVAVDAGIISIDSARGRCAGAVDLYATIRNFGSDTLTSAEINWSIDGVNQTSQSFLGSLSPNGTSQIFLGSTTYTTGVSHVFSAWTSVPNGLSDGNTINDTIITSPISTAMSGTYTIGATGSDFASFADAIASLENNGVCSATYLSVADGTYNERVVLHKIPNSSVTNTIFFHSASQDSTSVILQSPSSTLADSNYTICLDGVDNVNFFQMTFSRTGTNQYSNAIALTNGASLIYFYNNVISGPSSFTTSNTSGSQSGIFIDAVRPWNDLTVANNRFLHNSNGIWASGSSSDYARNILIYNNIFETFYVGTFILYSHSAVIEDNIFLRDNPASNVDYFGISLRYGSGQARIYKNKIDGYSGSYGIRLRALKDSTLTGCMVANNFVKAGGTVTGRGIAIEENCTSVNVYHNSINFTGSNVTLGRALYVDGATSDNLKIKNNVAVNSGGGFSFYVTANATASIVESDFNCFYSTGSPLAFFGSDASNLASLQTTSSLDSHSVSGDPAFFSASDLHSVSTLLANAGTPLPDVTTDIDNEIRNATTPDIGADEFFATKIENLISENIFILYPNPANEYLIIKATSENKGLFSATIFDIAGRVVLKKTDFSAVNSIISIADVPNGIYHIEIRNSDSVFSKSFVISR